LNELRLEYDKLNKNVSFVVNGMKVLNQYDVSNNEFVLQPVYAGFSGYDQKPGVTTVDNFSVTAGGAPSTRQP